MAFEMDLESVLLWQYENTNLSKLVSEMQAIAKAAHSDFWGSWTKDVFTLTTADEFGIAVWAKILDEQISIAQENNFEDIFGFGENELNFENGGFAKIYDGLEGIQAEYARKILLAKWFILTQAPTVPNINKLLSFLFDGTLAFVVDGLDMTITYTFEDMPDYRLRWLIVDRQFLPRPAGVGINFRVYPTEGFGFGVDNFNFENGGFQKERFL